MRPASRIDVEIDRLVLDEPGPDGAGRATGAVSLEVERLLAAHGLTAGRPEALREALVAAALERGVRR